MSGEKVIRMTQSEETVANVLGNIFAFVFILAYLSPFIMLLYQIVMYLKTSNWITFSVIDLLVYFHNTWAISPTDWHGLWNVLDTLNPAYLMPLIFLVMLTLAKFNEEQSV